MGSHFLYPAAMEMAAVFQSQAEKIRVIEMAKVHIKNEGKTFEIPDGSCLTELEGKTNVIFACKVGTCGACIATVLSGAENLAPPTETEKLYIDNFAPGQNKRLLCQAVINKGEVTIEY
jgi:ferredoxin